VAGNNALGRAGRAKNDEFYTQLVDVEAELRHYRDRLRGKVVFCNCDDPYESNFFKYFAMNFNYLGLKKLITTAYSGSPITATPARLGVTHLLRCIAP
jgi:Adenine-specific methyltransferase EcoRI